MFPIETFFVFFLVQGITDLTQEKHKFHRPLCGTRSMYKVLDYTQGTGLVPGRLRTSTRYPAGARGKKRKGKLPQL